MSDVPKEFIPEDSAVIADGSGCTECGLAFDSVPDGAVRDLEFLKVERDGETYCRPCLLKETDKAEKAEERRFCPDCHTESVWRPAGFEDEHKRICPWCGEKFRSTLRPSELGGTEEGE
jgi:hypothetical protein